MNIETAIPLLITLNNKTILAFAKFSDFSVEFINNEDKSYVEELVTCDELSEQVKKHISSNQPKIDISNIQTLIDKAYNLKAKSIKQIKNVEARDRERH